MKKQPRESLLLPILMPIAILGAILALTVGIALILLNMQAAAATATALVAATAVMVFAILAATRKRLAPGSIAGLIIGAVGVTLFFGGGLIALVGAGEEEAGELAEAVPLTITAKDVLFVETAVTVPADVPLAMTLDNQDAGIDHNIEIFDGPDANAPVLFDGEVFPGVAKVTYEVEPLAEGSFYFICKVHPTTMTGTFTAEVGAEVAYGTAEPSAAPSGEPTAAPSGEPSAQPTEEPKGGKAQVLKIAAPVGAVSSGYDVTSLQAKAGAPITIEFDNQDTGVPHDVDVQSPDGASVISDNEIITGPAKASYDIGTLEPGTYPFLCSVHPTTMTGTLTVK